MEGPTADYLLYLGQREEAALNLKTFQEQLTEVTRKRSKTGKAEVKFAQSKTTVTQVECNGRMRTVTFRPGAQTRYKCGKTTKQVGLTEAGVGEDGKLFIDADGWQRQKEIKYVVDPRLQVSYVTTAALANQEIKLEGRPEAIPVRAHEVGHQLAEWMGTDKAQYAHTVRA